MATLNFAQRELLCKIVYYGPALGGKTTNLRQIHSKVPAKYRGNLTSIDTRLDRTLFFDLLPLDYGKFRDFSIRLQLYTVPGQVFYNASRKIVLKGVDGIVFVADSQTGRMSENVESLINLRNNLREQNIDPDSVPMILQYNKRDVNPKLSLDDLNKALNKRNLQTFEAIATESQGVFTTLKAITTVVIQDIKRNFEVAVSLPPPVKVQRVGVESGSAVGPVTAPAPQAQPRPRMMATPAQPLQKRRSPVVTVEADRTKPAERKPDAAAMTPAQLLVAGSKLSGYKRLQPGFFRRIITSLFKWVRK